MLIQKALRLAKFTWIFVQEYKPAYSIIKAIKQVLISAVIICEAWRAKIQIRLTVKSAILHMSRLPYFPQT